MQLNRVLILYLLLQISAHNTCVAVAADWLLHVCVFQGRVYSLQECLLTVLMNINVCVSG